MPNHLLDKKVKKKVTSKRDQNRTGKKKLVSTDNIFIKKILKLHLLKKCQTVSDLLQRELVLSIVTYQKIHLCFTT